MNQIDVAVLGLGRMGGHHAEVAKSSDFIRKVFGYEPEDARRIVRCHELGVHPASLEDILENDEIRLIYIATPNETHTELAIRALRAGKAVLCEKPMGMNLQQAEQLLEVERETNGFLQIGFELRYSRMYQQTQEWIAQGKIGELVATHCRYYCCEFHGRDNWRSQSGGSFLVGEKLSHYLDLKRWWMQSSPESIYSASSPKVVPYFNHRDNHQMTLKFPGEKIGTLSFIMYVAETHEEDPLTETLAKQSDDGHALQYYACGTKGAIESDVFRRRLRRWEFSEGPNGLLSRIAETITFPPEEDDEYFHNGRGQNLRVAELVVKGLPPEVSASDAFETMKICFAAERSEDEGRVVMLSEFA